MLEKLSKFHNEWLRIATSICKSEDKAKDLVQDMYIKMSKSKRTFEEINNKPGKLRWYIYRVINSVFIDELRKKKNVISIEELHSLEDLKEDNDTLEFRKMINKALRELDVYDVTVLLETHERSLRKSEKHLNINFMTLHNHKKKALEKFKRTETIREFRKLNK